MTRIKYPAVSCAFGEAKWLLTPSFAGVGYCTVRDILESLPSDPRIGMTWLHVVLL